MKSTEEMKEKIIEVLKNLSDNDVMDIWNDELYPYDNNEHIFEMSEINDILSNNYTPLEIIKMVQNGKFYSYDDYFAFDDYGNLISFNDIYDKADLYIIADYAINMEEDFCNDEIERILNGNYDAEVLDEYEEESEEE